MNRKCLKNRQSLPCLLLVTRLIRRKCHRMGEVAANVIMMVNGMAGCFAIYTQLGERFAISKRISFFF